jgi:hypothetical protein
VGIDKADSDAHHPLLFDKVKEFIQGDTGSDWKGLKEDEELLSVLDVAAGKLPDDEGVASHPPVQEQLLEVSTSLSQVCDPDRGIDENHG